MIKFNEAISIKKTYEIILKRLKEERLAYDKQLESMEKAIKAKNADFDELLMLSHDANHAR
jgi:coiled-coil domain-containing protein 151